ncbi:MAG: 4-alpha-glucanotransferase [Rhizomicrobium sp.]
MIENENLRLLADEAGIEPRYWDILGNLHEMTADAARSVLAALGLPANSEADVAASLAALRAETWCDPLPPVLVARESEPIAVPLRFPSLGGPKTIRWSVRLENGEVRTGECDAFSLAVAATGECRGTTMELRNLALAPMPLGYHEFVLDGVGDMLLIVAPSRCHDLPEGRHWGLAAQLYALNTQSNWGIGDFSDLKTLVEFASDRGAATIGLNPLHALFLDTPEQASPYSPSSRLFHNPLYLDVTAIPDFAECGEARSLVVAPQTVHALAALRAGRDVQYKPVADLKMAMLERLHRGFAVEHVARNTPRGRAYVDYVERSGTGLQNLAMHQVLTERYGTHDWTRWPTALRDCDATALAGLRTDHSQRIDFFCYLQWLCEEQLAGAARNAQARGMAVGLYTDLAVSVDAASADHWMNQGLFAAGLRIGAPPDPFNARGQEWGVVPLNPRKLRATRYGHFIALLRANMRHAGALRIDHVMGWQRLFLIPSGAPAASGAYLRYPLDDLLGIAALESRRNRCVIIGEDLGTVPEGFRERMAAANVFSTRVFYFERENGRYRAPRDYPPSAAVTAATHDLPTLRGFWSGDDIAAKEAIRAVTSQEAAQARQTRSEEKASLLHALAEEGLLPNGSDRADADWTADLGCAVQVYLARTPSRLLLIQLDDLADELHQANLPGSTTEYPNWRRRLSRTLAELQLDSGTKEGLAAVSFARGNG